MGQIILLSAYLPETKKGFITPQLRQFFQHIMSAFHLSYAEVKALHNEAEGFAEQAPCDDDEASLHYVTHFANALACDEHQLIAVFEAAAALEETS